MSVSEHESAAASIVARCAIVTFSDTRTSQTDTSGKRIQSLLESGGHVTIVRQLVGEDPQGIAELLESLLTREGIDAILTTGGTGISRRDETVPAIARLLDTELPGFGELFRMLSFHEIGSAALMSRALAGIARGRVLFAMPGSTKAVELAMTKLILPQLGHLLYELKK